MLTRTAAEGDFEAMLSIINAAAQAYRGVIPADRWHEPYMSADALRNEIAAGVLFWVAEVDGRVCRHGSSGQGSCATLRASSTDPF